MVQTLWGFPIGYFRYDKQNIPVILDSEKAGFCLHYDLEEENRAEQSRAEQSRAEQSRAG